MSEADIKEHPATQQARYEVYGHYWDSKEQALWYRDKIDGIKWQLGEVLGKESEVMKREWEEALFIDHGSHTSQRGWLLQTTRVQRISTLIQTLQSMVVEHGENVALRRRYMGMGYHEDEVVLLAPGHPDTSKEKDAQ